MHEIDKQTKQVRAGIYARSATKDPSAIDRQIANCKQIAYEYGWELDDRYIFQDDPCSGMKTAGRPGFDQLLTAVQDQTRPINVLLVEEGSRLGRDLRRVVEILDMFTACGVSVYIAETKLELSGPTGRQFFKSAGFVDNY
jgi:DNA invertase Pin-like site-specific DNA recombinase